MHLAILTQYYPPEIGAPQARLSEMATRFAQKNHQVTVLTAMPNYPTGKIHKGYGGVFRKEKQGQIDVIRTFIYPTQKADMVHRLANYFSFVFSSALLGAFRLNHIDYLMVESPPLFLGLSAYWLTRLKRTRLIFNVSDLWPESAVRLGMVRAGSLSYKVSSWLEASCYKSAWLVTGQSKSILADITGRFAQCKTYHFSNGVDPDLFSPSRRAEETRTILIGDSEPSTCIAVYVGLHGLAQGLEQIVALARSMEAEPRLRFVLIGDGPEKKQLVEQANGLSNIRFLEARPKEQIPSLIAAADIVLVSLKMYIPGAVPSKLYEAMASGKAVILIAEGEAADIVHEYQSGIVVQPGDLSGLEKATKTLFQNPLLRQELGENGRQAARTIFNRELIVDRYIDYLAANLQK